MSNDVQFTASLECPECGNTEFLLIKPDASKSEIVITCRYCNKKIGKVEDYFVKNCDD